MTQLKRYNGIGWESLSNGVSTLQGGVTGSLISEQIISSDISSVIFSGLSSLLDGDYTLECSIVSSKATGESNIFFNDDTTATNYYTQVLDGSGSGASANRANSSKFLYIATNPGRSYATTKIKVAGGYVSALTVYAYGSVSTPSIQNKLTLYSVQVASLSKITITSDITGAIGIGSTFRLYSSKTPNALISYSPLDYTDLTSDRLLRAGEVAFIKYTNATSVPLNIATEEGLYEIELIGDLTSSTPVDVDTFLSPNVRGSVQPSSNITYTDSYQISGSSISVGAGTNGSRFTISNQLAVLSKAHISTYTKNKSFLCNYVAQRRATNSTTLITRTWNALWVDTTSVWSSLGSLIFTSASQSGRAIIRRII